MPKPGPVCPYCEGNPPSMLMDAGEVYGEKYEGQFNLWVCQNRCGATVGVVTGSLDAEPAGTLANAGLRALRKRLKQATSGQKMTMRDRIRHLRLINHSDENQCRRALMALDQPATKETHV